MEDEKSKLKVPEGQHILSAEFFSQVIDSLPDYSIFTVDNDLKINSWSSGSIQLFQYGVEEIMGKDFEIIFTEEDKKNGLPKSEIAKALKEGKAADNRWHIRKDGSKFYAYGLVYPLTSDDGKMKGYVKILRDLTERQNAEKYAKEAEELSVHKQSILFILTHDFRSLLTGVTGTAEYLNTNFDKMDKVKAKEMLELLYTTSKEELNLLDYLVDWARIKYAAEPFAPTKIELYTYVKNIFDTLNENAVANDIHLHNDIDEDINVFADGDMLLSVLRNLISNAIKYSNKGGKILVTAKRNENQIIIEIKDNGIGITKEIQNELFTPQITTISDTWKKDKETGIGLLLSKGFVEINGGKIWVESIENEGSSFYFTLPIG
ncbi:MAG: PAS domain-containing sensor histidine kinase [Bacteroidota bacterium]|nr:PAS domain-containing sensor histidine kinase [Bacteroidota bacterium]